MILAVDNRYGLTYFAGSKERLTGKYFEGLEGYVSSEGVATFSKEAIIKTSEAKRKILDATQKWVRLNADIEKRTHCLTR